MELRKLLELKKMSQQELADALDIPRNTVWRWVNGRATPSVDVAKEIAAALGVSEAELLNGPEENKIRLELVFTKMEEEEFVDMTGNKNVFSLFLSPDGVIGIRGAAKFTTLEEIERFLTDAGGQLKEAFKWQQERGALATA